jgi:hypothetical protein
MVRAKGKAADRSSGWQARAGQPGDLQLLEGTSSPAPMGRKISALKPRHAALPDQWTDIPLVAGPLRH